MPQCLAASKNVSKRKDGSGFFWQREQHGKRFRRLSEQEQVFSEETRPEDICGRLCKQCCVNFSCALAFPKICSKEQ